MNIEAYRVLEAIPRVSRTSALKAVKYDGLREVLDAFDYYSYQMNEPRRFLHLVKALKYEDTETQLSILDLVNTLITSSSMDSRRSLRGQFERVGLLEIVLKFHGRKKTDSQLINRVRTYLDTRKMDDKHWQSKLGEYVDTNLSADNDKVFPKIAAYIISNVTENPNLRVPFFDLLCDLTQIETDDVLGARKWRILEKLASELKQESSIITLDDQEVLSIKEIAASADAKDQLEAKYLNQLESMKLELKKKLTHEKTLRVHLSYPLHTSWFIFAHLLARVGAGSASGEDEISRIRGEI